MRLGIYQYVLLVALCTRVHGSAPACFDHSNVQNPLIFACQPEANVSSCCSPGDICYSNGLCAPSSPVKSSSEIAPFFFNGCTGNTFDPDVCINGHCATTQGNGILPCPNLETGHYCCYGSSGCNCSNLAHVFTLPPGTIVTTIKADVTLSSTSAKPSITSKTTSSSRTSSGESITATQEMSATLVPTFYVTSAPTSTPTNTSVGSPKTLSRLTMDIGISLGVGIPTLAVAVMACVLWFSKRVRKVAKNASGLGENRNFKYLDTPEKEYYKPRYEMEGSTVAVELDSSNATTAV